MREKLSEYEGKIVTVFGPEERKGSKLGQRCFVRDGDAYTIALEHGQISLTKIEKEDLPKIQVQPLDESLMTPVESGLVKKAQAPESFKISGCTQVEGKNVYFYADTGGVCSLCYST